MMSKRRTHSPEFPTKFAMKAISGRKTLQQSDADHGGHSHSVESSDDWEAEVKVDRFIWMYRHVRSLSALDCKNSKLSLY